MIIENIKINNEKQYQKMIMKSNLMDNDLESNDIVLTSFKRNLYKIIEFKSNIDNSILDNEGNLKDIKVNLVISLDTEHDRDNYYGLFLFLDRNFNIMIDNEIKNFKLKNIYYIEEIFITSYSGSETQILSMSSSDLTFQLKTKYFLERREIIELEILLKPYESFIENFNSKNK